MNKFKVFLHFMSACIGCFLIASVLQTQMVIAGLSDINVNVSMAARLNMTLQDIVGLAVSYGLVVVAGLLIGFSVAKAIRHFTPIQFTYLYPLAGCVTMLVILAAMQPILGVTLLAGARTATGIILQALAGFIGGIIFMRLRTR